MKNLTADQLLRKTFEHLDQVLNEKKEPEEMQTTLEPCKQNKKKKRKVEAAEGHSKSGSSL